MQRHRSSDGETTRRRRHIDANKGAMGTTECISQPGRAEKRCIREHILTTMRSGAQSMNARAVTSYSESGTNKKTVRIPEPCIAVIFGASGDLTRRKLLPALYQLGQSNLLPDDFAVVGVARRDLSTISRPICRTALRKTIRRSLPLWAACMIQR
jgi:Glucose-6-phosphate dehydrogenase, NAD binding domain